MAEREEISRGMVADLSLRRIASRLGRAPSTVSREMNRNGGRRDYRANQADEAAWERAHRPKTCKLSQNPALARIVAEKLQLEWSPRQIAGWLKVQYADDETYQVSHETIYLTLFIQARGALKKELLQYLRRPRAMRRSRHSKLKGKGLGQIATLVERHTRYVMLVRVPSKDTRTVINALIKQAHKLPRELYKSLTWDRGAEMADHQKFSLATDVKVYFCDPQHPWQRGSNENTNGLLRQYFPKGMDLSNIHQNRLNAVARRLDERPRETLQFRTPAEKFSECVASTD
jgi:IS30 family transposase